MSVFMDTTTGMGLSGATGVRPYLPPLLAGALARGDTGIDFDGTDWRFLESSWFLLAVLAVGVIAYLAERSEANRRSVELFGGVVGVLVGGAVCAALGWRAVGGLVERTRARLKDGPAALLTAYADGAALVLAAIAIFLPPASILAIAGFVVLLFAGRRREGEKYAGLRVLR
jgi:hypothetical protein